MYRHSTTDDRCHGAQARLTPARFQYIFYIDGSTRATISPIFSEIAKRYNFKSYNVTEWNQRMEQLTVWGEWLMIFDDCEISDRRRGYLPGGDTGNVIYTSRSTTLRNELPPDCCFEITPFDEGDAIDLLLKASCCENTSPDSGIIDSARALVQELGGLPLAIDMAAAHIRTTQCSLQDYLEKFRDQKWTAKVSILSVRRPLQEKRR